MENKKSKNYRVLDIYVRFCEGKAINKGEEANKFGVDERSIQRDIDDIRAFLEERRINDSNDFRDIKYDRVNKIFKMTGIKSAAMTNSEILAVVKILLESRAFTKKEMNRIIKKIIGGCVPMKNMKIVSDLIANERYHYTEIQKEDVISKKLWEIGTNIKEHEMLEIEYIKIEKEKVKRIIEPMSLLFSEYYFYLIAFITKKDENGDTCV